jgi:hypothetical protein
MVQQSSAEVVQSAGVLSVSQAAENMGENCFKSLSKRIVDTVFPLPCLIVSETMPLYEPRHKLGDPHNKNIFFNHPWIHYSHNNDLIKQLLRPFKLRFNSEIRRFHSLQPSASTQVALSKLLPSNQHSQVLSSSSLQLPRLQSLLTMSSVPAASVRPVPPPAAFMPAASVRPVPPPAAFVPAASVPDTASAPAQQAVPQQPRWRQVSSENLKADANEIIVYRSNPDPFSADSGYFSATKWSSRDQTKREKIKIKFKGVDTLRSYLLAKYNFDESTINQIMKRLFQDKIIAFR